MQNPKVILLTTPNIEYNVLYKDMDIGKMRHPDHRFEWSRKEFKSWALHVAEKYNYKVEILPIGEEEENVGAPAQMGIFKYDN